MIFDPGIDRDTDWLRYIAAELNASLEQQDGNEENLFVREGVISFNYRICECKNILLDTGASHGNYVGKKTLWRLGVDERPGRDMKKCSHRVRLGDGETVVLIESKITLTITLRDPFEDHRMHTVIEDFYVSDSLGDLIIVGRPTLLTSLIKYFLNVIISYTGDERNSSLKIQDLNAIAPQWPDHFIKYENYKLVQPWKAVPELCPEDEETPHPLSFNDDTLAFMEVSVEESRREYLTELDTHVSDEMKKQCPSIMNLLKSDLALDVFAPSEWRGMDVEPATMHLKTDLPTHFKPKARPVRPDLFEHAKKEYDRLSKYIYVPSDSPVASPLVIAPKATAPFIRFCGDYRRINEMIYCTPRPIPIVQHELMKAANFKTFVDLDMANSFHQIPLSKELSDMLSIVTPWGLVRPLFLPEGVSPASGLLQEIVSKIFADYIDWIIVIFDNFLVLAHTYEDAYEKLQKVLIRCKEKGMVLKLKKSWIGYTEARFFGFVVSDGKWRLSDERKNAVYEIPFPTNKKEMQSFLGVALFFHHHIPNYSEWTARLYETIHDKFDWDPATWTHDYKEDFKVFLEALIRAMELHLPDYSKDWYVRADSSDYAVGGVLFQIDKDESGNEVRQPIGFVSKRYSKPAINWDTFKKEAFAMYFTVHAFAYYLRGKFFIMETDHRNLQWIENSEVPIVVRWRNLLQSFDFLVRHISGKQNIVADFLSRMRPPQLPTVHLLTRDHEHEVLTFEDMMKMVHGGRSLHFGASETWKRAKDKFPSARITIKAVREYVQECPLCQKTRDVGIRRLKPRTLHLKRPTYRSAIGVDHVTVTPADKHGNTCVILLVEHFAHFPQAYAAKTYDAVTLATVLFKHFCTFGVFDELVSDPGSAMMSDVVAQLNEWLGIRHKVSLVNRPQSNGCEGSGKQFLRHLTTLVFDERIVDKWSDDTVLPLINFSLASYPTSETGGYTPFQLKYGTDDAEYFRLPSDKPAANAFDLLKQLHKHKNIIRERSRILQEQIAKERAAKDGPHQSYEVGDLLLWDPLDHPKAHLPCKLSPRYSGPYRVIQQRKNDITCAHVVTNEVKVFHMSRVHPFFGTEEHAFEVAKLDKDQWLVLAIHGFIGNPNIRKSLNFYVEFETRDVLPLRYSNDLATNATFQSYINSRPILIPLRYTAAEFNKQKAQRNKIPIPPPLIATTGYIHLRYWDGERVEWFDTLEIPDKTKEYYLEIKFVSFANASHTKVNAHVPLLNQSLVLTPTDLWIYCIEERAVDAQHIVIVDQSSSGIYEQLLPYVNP